VHGKGEIEKRRSPSSSVLWQEGEDRGREENSTVWCRSLGPDLKAARPPEAVHVATATCQGPPATPAPCFAEAPPVPKQPLVEVSASAAADRGGAAAAIYQTSPSPRDARPGQVSQSGRAGRRLRQLHGDRASMRPTPTSIRGRRLSASPHGTGRGRRGCRGGRGARWWRRRGCVGAGVAGRGRSRGRGGAGRGAPFTARGFPQEEGSGSMGLDSVSEWAHCLGVEERFPL
jgi:hypothetical protein